MNLILLSANEIAQDGHCTLSDTRADHLRTYLHATPGQTFQIGIINGPTGLGTIEIVTPQAITFRCDCQTAPLAPWYDMVLALTRPRSLQRILFQTAAMGVRNIYLTGAQKVEKSYFSMHLLKEENLNSILIEGLMQGKTTTLPRVTVVPKLRDLWPLLPENTAGRWIANPTTEPLPKPSTCGGIPLIAIGPDGGWTTAENDAFYSHGFKAITLGQRPLRTDTAAIALPAFLIALGF